MYGQKNIKFVIDLLRQSIQPLPDGILHFIPSTLGISENHLGAKSGLYAGCFKNFPVKLLKHCLRSGSSM